MLTYKSLIKRCDIEYGSYIKERDNYRCLRCGVQYGKGSPELTISHFVGRAKMATRFEDDNCETVCGHCHAIMEKQKGIGQWYYEWKEDMLGVGGADRLKRQGNEEANFNTVTLRQLLKVIKEKRDTMRKHRGAGRDGDLTDS